MIASLGLLLYAAALVAAAASDLLRYRIPNWVVAAVVAAFALVATSLPWSVSLADLSAGLAVLVLAAAGFAAGLMGGGDAKLLAATALLTGWRLLLPFLLVTAIAGGALALALLLARRLAPAPLPAGRWWSRLLARGEGVPYGIAIALAGLVLLPEIAAAP